VKIAKIAETLCNVSWVKVNKSPSMAKHDRALLRKIKGKEHLVLADYPELKFSEDPQKVSWKSEGN
jgi:hypothetical protein